MSKLQSLAGSIAKTAFPSQEGGNYDLDIISIIEIALMFLEECDLSPEQMAERASSFSMFDRIRVRRNARRSGYERRDIGKVTDAFCSCCQSSPKEDLVAAMSEANEI